MGRRIKDPAKIDTVGFRFRNNDGSETAATWLSPESVDHTFEDVTSDVFFRLRLSLENDHAGSLPFFSAQLQYRLNGGAWVNIGFGSSLITENPSHADLTEEEATTQQLAVHAGSFFTGGVSINGGQVGDNFQLNFTSFTHTEVEYAVKVIFADVSNGDEIEFRISNADNDFSIPKLTINNG